MVNRKEKTNYPVDDLFIDRWSPQALSGEEIDEKELMSLFEAARWAPSSFNNQPWRFIYCFRGSDCWQDYLDLLTNSNKKWAKKAGALVIIASKKTFDDLDKRSRTHSFDTGAAWQNLALQASLNDLIAHGMEGFDYEQARDLANIPKGYSVEAMIAIGKPAPTKEKPNSRKKINKIVFKERFKNNE